jgi:hypothetical protein
MLLPFKQAQLRNVNVPSDNSEASLLLAGDSYVYHRGKPPKNVNIPTPAPCERRINILCKVEGT